MSTVGPLYRKALAATILMVLLFAVVFGILLPLSDLFGQKRDSVSTLEDRIARYQNILGREEAYRERLVEIEAAPLPGIAYEATSLTAASASLQNDIRQMIGRSGGRIESMQTLPPLQEGPFRKIGVRMSLRTDMKSLVQFLEGLDRHQKLVLADNISMRTSERQNNNRPPEVVIRWDLYGYALMSTLEEAQP
ncbi:type II secretion system protein GspM [Emcibacter nanhaiensis]|uniref:Type II secretion system protein M n=1 Tax=Emcibacter nanhaiensis TaxID=1505037 RepID=A0A501PFQ5_9PROT|nr:type II secretion system protein GspM [Emcibacter nanhaiensis]TPD58978.1 hypothetical protein FIV46_12135 [Emcibacter nanhaiensis]